MLAVCRGTPHWSVEQVEIWKVGHSERAVSCCFAAFVVPACTCAGPNVQQAEAMKAAYEKQLQPTAIDTRFGFQWALCCGVGCKAPCDACHCTAPAPLPLR